MFFFCFVLFFLLFFSSILIVSAVAHPGFLQRSCVVFEITSQNRQQPVDCCRVFFVLVCRIMVPSLCLFFNSFVFFLICPCAVVWMQFQMSCFKRHAKMYAVASVVHRFFPLDKNGVRFCCANAYTSRSHRWASNRMASRAVFTIGICQY